MQYSFVVTYDSADDTFIMDYDSQEVFFHNAPIYDPETEDYRRLNESDWEDEKSDYNRSADAIYMAIRDLRLEGK
jgi:hypothetical protein